MIDMIMRRHSSSSTRSQDRNIAIIPELNPNSLRFGEVRGSGTFSDIIEIDFQIDPSSSSNGVAEEEEETIDEEEEEKQEKQKKQQQQQTKKKPLEPVLKKSSKRGSLSKKKEEEINDNFFVMPQSARELISQKLLDGDGINNLAPRFTSFFSPTSTTSFLNLTSLNNPQQRNNSAPTITPLEPKRSNSSSASTGSTRNNSFLNHDSKQAQQYHIRRLSLKKKKLVAKVPRVFDSKTQQKLYQESIDCLRNEAMILSELQENEHIIKLYAISTFAHNPSRLASYNYFILLEELTSTLDNTLKEYATLADPSTTFLERLDVLFDLATALEYMHSQQIIHRDVKPSNVGFNHQGTLKLFDFGLAISLRNKRKVWGSGGLYHLQGGNGTCRYMAPEVAKCKPYNESCDVYSFGICIWEILSMKKPFAGYGFKKWQQCVLKGERPHMDGRWKKELRDLMRNCWSSTIKKRPPFSEIVEILRNCTCSWK